MWRKSESTKVLKATKSLATEWANMEGVPNDRLLDPVREARRKKDLDEGRLRDIEWSKCFCEETGKWYRINGKHTSNMLSKQETIPSDLQIAVQTYHADTLADAADLYATFDDRSSLRTLGDISKATMAAVPELVEFPKKFIGLAVTGMSLAIDGIPPPKRISAADKARRLVTDTQFVIWLHEIFISEKTAKHLWRGPVVAAIYSTYQKNRKDAFQFWILVRDETSTSPNTADRKLARWLNSVSIDNGQGAIAPRHKKTNTKECMAKCLTAWNAWRKGMPSDLKYYPEKRIPAPI